MPKISFRIRSDKAQAGIYLYFYSTKKVQFEFPVGISVRTAFWHKRQMRIVDSAPGAPKINEMLENIVSHMIRYLNANGHIKLKKKELQALVKLALGRPVKIEKRLSVQARNYVKQVPYLGSADFSGE